jgi:hydroxyacylglutathione hydrolase
MPAIIPIPAFADNYIWLVLRNGKAVVVDPGDAAPVLEYLEREGIGLCAIVNTRDHGDHVADNRAFLAGRHLPDRVAVFAEVRAWKNAF